MGCFEPTNVPPMGDALPTDCHQGGGFVRMQCGCGGSSSNAWQFWPTDVSANCHSLFNLKSINCIPISDFLTSPLQSDLDAGGYSITDVGKLIIGTNRDDGSGALLQVRGDINLSPGSHYLIDGHVIGEPAGTLGQVQFNNNGVFGASPNLFWHPTRFFLGVGVMGDTMEVNQFNASLFVATEDRAIDILNANPGPGWPTVFLGKEHGTLTSPTPVVVGDGLGYIGFGGKTQISPNTWGINGAEITSVVTSVNNSGLSADLYLAANNGTPGQEFAVELMRLEGLTGAVYQHLPASNPTSAASPISTMTVALTSNTQLTFYVKGADGIVRSANITLA